MLKSWLSRINLSLTLLVGCILLSAIWISILREREITHFEGPIQTRSLPRPDFNFDKEAYDTIGSGAFSLKFSPPSIQLPDLRSSLVYYGKNGRPDAQALSTLLHLSFTGNKSPSSITPDTPAFIRYDRNQTPPQYIFSPGNAETPLWIEVSPQGNLAIIKVGMLNDNGEEIHTPAAFAQFNLTEKETSRSPSASAGWEIGKLRVDGTLLARQKARWYGIDKFLERHGGKEFAELSGKQRIDIGEGENVYSIYIGKDDVVMWNGNRWETKTPGPETLGSPLMSIKKIDDRLMTFELWDVEGKNKVVLNLLKSTEAWIPQNIQQSFKFVGARTRSQFIFEINKERVLLSPKDWLVLTDGSWKKLNSPSDIDAYVDRKLIGPLFVFDGVEKKDDKQILIGTLFNSTRTEMQSIEILMQQNTKAESAPKTPQKASPSSETKREPVQTNLPSQEIMRGRMTEENKQQ